MSTLNQILDALQAFVATIDATGGVERNSDGYPAPVADPEWTDLGFAYLKACDSLGRKPEGNYYEEEGYGG